VTIGSPPVPDVIWGPVNVATPGPYHLFKVSGPPLPENSGELLSKTNCTDPDVIGADCAGAPYATTITRQKRPTIH
jgi:hypothetical protein